MLADYSGWLAPIAVVLISDLVLWWAAYLAGRRSVRREVEASAAAATVESSAAEADSSASRTVIQDGIEHLDSRLTDVVEALGRICENRPPPQSETPPQADGVLDFAARLARRGSDVDELVELCNLGRSEAELIHALHSARPQAVA